MKCSESERLCKSNRYFSQGCITCQIRGKRFFFQHVLSALQVRVQDFTEKKTWFLDHFAALGAHILQCPSRQCRGKMPNAQHISISYYSNSHGADNMAAKGELQRPSCVCLCGFTHERQAQHLGARF